MQEEIGNIDCQGAVFVYKDDKTASKAWDDVKWIDQDHGGIRGEIHDNRASFLSGISHWNSLVDPSNAFLCIYAHMGPLGINCINGNAATRVLWQDLAATLSHPVELIWLVGCKSNECMTAWAPLSSPVRHLLLATFESKPWRPLLRCFAAEIDIKHIRFYDEMPQHLESEQPELGKLTGYFRPTASGFKPAFAQ